MLCGKLKMIYLWAIIKEKGNTMFYIPFYNETSQEFDQHRFSTLDEAKKFAAEKGYNLVRHDNGDKFFL